MKTAYRVFAYLIAALVMVQAAAVAYGFFGLGKWVEDGGTLDKGAMESDTVHFTGGGGLAVHGIVGSAVVPLVALLFVVLALFAKVPGGVKWALITFATVVVQVVLGIAAHSVPALGMLHGLVALALFGVAITAAMRVSRVGPANANVAAPVMSDAPPTAPVG
jgi:heme A synthase